MEPKKSGRAASIDYLRAFITLLVLYHHSTLAYTTFAQQNHTNFLMSTAPIVDTQRWAFLDYAENFSVHAAVKFLITCVSVIALSWLSSQLLLKIQRVRAIA